ncbi:MAG: winged helix-turn-helix transcriptional regulator [Betaproteobacteria bacterium]|nr:winged helix-turn-helix transcriptional regulator [Betaproteobacteria bacterium]
MPATRNASLLKECALFDIQRASRVVAGLYNAHLRDAGLTIAQFSILRNIAALQPVGIVRLAGALAMERTSVTRLVEPLIEAGFVRATAGEDRRVRNIEVTAKGQARIRAAKGRWRAAQRELYDTLGKGEWIAMRNALRTTVRKVRERHERP